MAKRGVNDLANNARVREVVFPITVVLGLIVTAGGGFFAWEQMKTEVENLKSEMQNVGKIEDQVDEIDHKQGVLGEKIEGLAREQDRFRQDTRDALDSISNKLDHLTAPRP